MSHPWIEKYRPRHFDHIVLDPLNRALLSNVLDTGHFPHLLLYGPPGTGKTTTILNMVQTFQQRYQQQNRELVIHLNASDERGIDVIRNQIAQFVHSKHLFHVGTKFVVLDEVDYTTKCAQQALKQLVQTLPSHTNVRFCLICNYVSRLDEGLQNEFVKLRFNQLPEHDIVHFLQHIVESEGLCFSEERLRSIQRLYGSDIRSMVNFLQANQHCSQQVPVLTDQCWEDLLRCAPHVQVAAQRVRAMEAQFNQNGRSLMEHFLMYLVRHKPAIHTPEFYRCLECVLHSSVSETSTAWLVQFVLSKVFRFLLPLNGDDCVSCHQSAKKSEASMEGPP